MEWNREVYDAVTGLVNIINLITISLIVVEVGLATRLDLSRRDYWACVAVMLFLIMFAGNRILFVLTEDFFYRANIAIFYMFTWFFALLGTHQWRKERSRRLAHEHELREIGDLLKQVRE